MELRKWYVKSIAEGKEGTEYHPCGTDYTQIVTLKTLRGVLKRVKNNQYRKNVVRVDVFLDYDGIAIHSFKPTNYMSF